MKAADIGRAPTALKRSAGDRSAASSFILLSLLLALQLFLFRPYYRWNDDTFKVFFTQGVGTDLAPSAFMGYSNPLWGLFFKCLFTAFPHEPWYGFVMISIQFLSLFAIFYAVRLAPFSRFKDFFWVPAFFGVFFSYFSSIQFTATASLAAQGGLFLLMGLWRTGSLQKKGPASFFASFLLIISSLIRFDGFALTLFAALPFLVSIKWSQRNPWRSLDRKPLWGATILLILFGAVYNYAWYHQDKSWSDFNRFDHERVELQDYRIDPYNESTKPFFDEAGWSRNDYDMFKGWYFMDKDVFDAAKMEKLKLHFPRIGSAGKPSSFQSLGALLSDFSAKTALMFFLCFLLFCSPRWLPFFLVQSAWIFLILIFMIYFYRAPGHVVLPLLTFLMTTAIFFSDEPSKRSWLSMTGMAFLVLCTCSSLVFYDRAHVGQSELKVTEMNLDHCLQALNPQDDQLYVTWDSSFPYESFNAFDDFDIFRKMHLFTLAVYQRSPDAQKMLDHFGIKDLFLDMVDNPKLFLICSSEESLMFRRYMLERHRMEIVGENVFTCPYFKVYRIHSTGKKPKSPTDTMEKNLGAIPSATHPAK